MADSSPTSHSAAPGPISSLDDPRALQILSTEHWSLLTARSLAYNEAFTRGNMFLSFLSMSFVALALFAQGMSFDRDFLAIAAIVLAFDLVIGLVTYARIIGANVDDMVSVHGMGRIRHAYVEAAPIVESYFTSATHDDAFAIGMAYGSQPTTYPGVFLYGLTTSGGMIGLITAMVGGVLLGVLGLLTGMADGAGALVIGLAGAVAVFVVITVRTTGTLPRAQRRLPVLFPTPADHPSRQG